MKYKQYRIGDKLLCKKDLKTEFLNNTANMFLSNKYYLITNIDNFYVYLRVIESVENSGKWFSVDSKNPRGRSAEHITKYFYTPQEIRKQKLKQLNEI